MKIFTKLALALLTIGYLSTVHAAGDASRGKAISSACVACHGMYGLSNSGLYPNLAGQKAEYLISALQQYQSKQRSDANMQAQVGPLTAQNIEDLAAYYAGNSNMPEFNANTGKLSLPWIYVTPLYYQADLQLQADGSFKLLGTPQAK